MRTFDDVWNSLTSILTSGIAGSQVTPMRLLLVVAATAALVWVTRRVTRWFVDRVLARREFDIGVREALGAILRYALISLGTLVILQSAGIDLTSLNVLVGAIGVGLGFGLQNITSNFFSGLILLLERPVKIGDRIEIAGIVGEVHEIGARATTIVTDESVATIIPNSQLVSERVTNWSRPDKLTAYLLPVYAAHTADPDLVRRLLLAAAAEQAGVLPNPRPEVEFQEVGKEALRFQLQVWSVEHLKTAGTLKSDLNFAVWRHLSAAGVAIRPPNGLVAMGLPMAAPPEA